MKIAVTGHRPDKLGGYTPKVTMTLVELAVRNMGQCRGAHVITGMALGWDLAVAEACCALGVEWTAAIPFNGQEFKWPDHQKSHYRNLQAKATRIYVVSPGEYHPAKMILRNHWMVDELKPSDGDLVLALWNGDHKGGTAECVAYARNAQVPVLNVWSEWEALNK